MSLVRLLYIATYCLQTQLPSPALFLLPFLLHAPLSLLKTPITILIMQCAIFCVLLCLLLDWKYFEVRDALLGGIGGRRRGGRQSMRWLDGITNSMDMTPGVGDGQGGLACCDSRGHQESDTTECLNSTELKNTNASSPRFYVTLTNGGEEIHKRHCSEGNYQSS